MDASILDKAQSWLNSSIDEDSKKDIQRMIDASDDSELVDSFYKDLEFGTGGLRGIMGTGSNRINKYTIGKATQGLSNYLLKCFPNEEIKVAIAHDSRNNSQYFAETTAAVFSANGIKVYFFEDLRPTPELSFAIRKLNCKSGVVLTASHNPKEYNGYKAYWEDGAQVTPPHDKNIIEEVNKIESFDEVNFDKRSDLIETIGVDIDEDYLEMISSLSLAPQAIKNQKDLKIVFSPIHGTGITLVPEILKKIGFENVRVVQEQAEPDGNFPTVVYPNPEEKEAMSLALKKAQEIDADIIMATDPDSDRVGIGIKDHHGKFVLLNGNQTGALLLWHVLQQWKESNKLDGNQFTVATIVTSDLLPTISDAYNTPCYRTLTGFKYIASIIRELEGKKKFVVGGEESYGYLIGDDVRDKDAIASCALIAEMAAYAKDNGKSLSDMLIEMYEKFGFYKERLISITKKGKEGADQIAQMMVDLRQNAPDKVGGEKVIKKIDYQSLEETDLISGTSEKIDFPKSNVLQFLTEKGTKISARPSGTEPKIKFYFSVNTPLEDKSKYDEISGQLDEKIDRIIADLNLN